MRNVEIKATVHSVEEIEKRAKQLSKEEGTVIKQHDTFFKVQKGRFKLRQFEDDSGVLIYYERPDTEGPKLSDYTKTSLDKEAAFGIKEVLAKANGIIGVVQKIRKLYMVGQTRVHIDEVKNLGNFMELEVVLNKDQTLEEGQEIAEDLMGKLGVAKSDLISGAYLDLIMARL